MNEPSKQSIQERLNQIRKTNTDVPNDSSFSSQSKSTLDLQSQFDDAYVNGNVSKDKFGYFIQKANEQFQSYERELSLLKRKTSFFDTKDLSTSQNEEFTLSASQQEKFIRKIKQRSQEENATLNDIMNEYNAKMVELFAENEKLNNFVDKLSSEVIDKLNNKIYELDIKCSNEEKEKEDALAKLRTMDSVFEQNSQMKEEIQEKDEELNDLNNQQIKNINRIEVLSTEIKSLNEEIKTHIETIAEKEKMIQDNINEIKRLSEEIANKDSTIKEKDKYIKEKEDEIKTLYNDNLQWEEKYSIQSKEIDNFKRWSLWDQNLIESFKKIEALEIELQKSNEKIEEISNENVSIKGKNSELKSTVQKLTEENKKLSEDNDALMLVKIQYDKEKEQFDDYIQVKKDYANLKKELTITTDKYESELITERKNFEVRTDEMKNMYETKIDTMNISHQKEIEELNAKYQNEAEEKKKEYDEEIKDRNNQILEKKEQLETLQSTNKEIASMLDKKNEMFTNLKDLYETLSKKLKEKEDELKEIKDNPDISSSIKPETIVNVDGSQSEPQQSKVYSTFDKYAFTKTILIDYLFCLYLYETSVNIQLIVRNIRNNIEMYNMIMFQSNSMTLPTVQSEILTDIYFIAYDLVISKKMTVSKNSSKKAYAISFENFDRDTINEIVNTVINKNFINRMKSPKSFEGLLPLFISKYEKVFDFDAKFEDFINNDIVPVVSKKVNAQALTLIEDMTTLVELTLHNIKDGKIFINGKEVYSFDKFYDQYFNIANISNRSIHIDISKKLNTIQAIDNVVNSIKYYLPNEFTVQKCFDNKEGNGVYKVTSAITLYLDKKLTQLSLLGNTISGVIFRSRVIPMMSSLRELISVDLSGNDLNDDDIKMFCEFLKTNKTLKIVVLSNNKLTSNGGFFLADALVKNKTIDTLNISHNSINNGGITSLLNVLTNNNNTVSNLNIGYNNLKSDDFQSLSDYLSSNPNLTTIDISGNTIDPLSANIVGIALKKAKKITKAKFNRTGLNDESCPQLLNFLNETNITDIELDMNSFGTMGPIIIIGKFKASPNLKRVSLRQCDLKAMILDVIAKNLKNCENLEIMNLEWNLFDDASFEKFCNEMEDNTNIVFKFSRQMLSQGAIELGSDLKNIILI